MFVDPFATVSPITQGHDALAAMLTLILIGCGIWAFHQTKPTTQRVLLRLMFQPVLASTLFFTLWLMALLFSLFLTF